LVDRERGIIVPSAAYAPQMWTRDAFWIALATGEVQTNRRALQRLAALQALSGQIPTWTIPDAQPARHASSFAEMRARCCI